MRSRAKAPSCGSSRRRGSWRHTPKLLAAALLALAALASAALAPAAQAAKGVVGSFGSAGTAGVADTDNNRIEQFSASGSFVRAWGWGIVLEAVT